MRIKRTLAAALTLGALGAAGVVGATGTPAGAETTIGTIFEHRDYGGARSNFPVTNNGYICTQTINDVDAGWATLSYPWGATTSSWRVYSSCWARGWEQTSFRGSSLGFQGNTPYLGPLNDKIRSIQFS